MKTLTSVLTNIYQKMDALQLSLVILFTIALILFVAGLIVMAVRAIRKTYVVSTNKNTILINPMETVKTTLKLINA